jgi:hypothetical protein
MQAVWDGLASDDNLDFIAMSQYLNGDGKGSFFNNFVQTFVNDPAYRIPQDLTGWHWATGDTSSSYSAADALYAMVGQLEKTLYGVLEMKSSDMQTMIDRTNNRIYGELQVISMDERKRC